MNKLLYFPKIEIQDTEWLVRALLYWDKVATIVPTEIARCPEKFKDETRLLLKENLLSYCFPESYIKDFHAYQCTFLNLVDTDPYFIRLQELSKVSSIGLEKILFKSEYVHLGKLQGIGEELVTRGLAQRKGSWYKIEKTIANTYMTYLATVISYLSDYTPVSDKYRGLRGLVDTSVGFCNEGILKDNLKEQYRAKILKNIMPIPCEINVIQLLRFKEKYHDELIRYRKFIEEMIVDLDFIVENRRFEKLEILCARANEEITILVENMRDSGHGEIRMDSICGIASSALPIIGSVATNNPVGALASLPQTLKSAYEIIKADDRNLLKDKPLAYAAFLSKNDKRKKIYVGSEKPIFTFT